MTNEKLAAEQRKESGISYPKMERLPRTQIDELLWVGSRVGFQTWRNNEISDSIPMI